MKIGYGVQMLKILENYLQLPEIYAAKQIDMIFGTDFWDAVWKSHVHKLGIEKSIAVVAEMAWQFAIVY